VQKICSERGNLLVLEIGSWSGESAILWAEAAKQTLREIRGQTPSICVDPWTSYVSLDENPHIRIMRKAAVSDKIFSLSFTISNRQARVM
jgi:hypothetical protein